jgi:uncharacterized phage protein (TIGR01671 family)
MDVKVRVWDEKSKKMFYPEFPSVGILTDGTAVFDNGYCEGVVEHWIPNDQCVFMLDTGLKDKNGKKIYGGDIIRIEEHHFSPCNFVVEFSEVNHCWWVSSTSKDYIGASDFSFSFSDLNGFEYDSYVVGNIYENPDLIPEEKS